MCKSESLNKVPIASPFKINIIVCLLFLNRLTIVIHEIDNNQVTNIEIEPNKYSFRI